MLARHGVRSFVLTGGEPTLLADFARITAALAGMTVPEVFFVSAEGTHYRPRPVEFAILTNGDTPAWTKALCSSLAGTQCRVHVHLAGPPDVHDAVTGGSHARALRTIQRAVAAGIAVVVNVPLFKGNLASAGAIARAAADLGVQHVNVMRALPVGRARSSPEIIPTPAEFWHAFQELALTCRARGINYALGAPVPQCHGPPLDSPAAGVPLDDPLPTLCGCGTHSFCVDPSGLVRPCTCSPVIGGPVVEVQASLASAALRAFRDRGHPPACAGCASQASCSGGCPATWYGRVPFPLPDNGSGKPSPKIHARDPWTGIPFPKPPTRATCAPPTPSLRGQSS